MYSSHQGERAETSDVVASKFLILEGTISYYLIPALLVCMLVLELYVFLLFFYLGINFDASVISPLR